MRISKGMVQAALREISCIHELATDPQAIGGTYAYHAPSANRYLETLAKAKTDLPAWIARNRKHLESQGWRFPYNATFEAAAQAGRPTWAVTERDELKAEIAGRKAAAAYMAGDSLG